MKIYYIRHGQTDWNLAKKMQGGQTERPLNETGIKQAEETKEQLKDVKYDIVICSPMIRAKQTAELVNQDKKIDIIVDERLRERKLGELEGHIVTEEIENKIWDYELDYHIQGGESVHDFEKRILEFIKEIKQKYNDKQILIVAHGGIAKVLKANLYEMPESKNLADIVVKNCEILEFEI